MMKSFYMNPAQSFNPLLEILLQTDVDV